MENVITTRQNTTRKPLRELAAARRLVRQSSKHVAGALSRNIATREASATSLRMCRARPPVSHKRESWPWVYEAGLRRRSPGTDNRGGGSALNKLMTSSYPASAVLMEMSALLKHRGLQASVQWAPRAANREADRLANGFTQDFNPDCECVIDLATVPWILLPRALDEGRQAEQAYQNFFASGRDP